MAWIESHDTLARHPKTKRLMRALNIGRAQAIGHLHLLWWWTLEFAQDGDLSRFAADELADAAEWEGDPDAFLAALVQAGFVDAPTPTAQTVHDWQDYAGRLVDQRERNAAKQRAWRARNHGDVTPSPPADPTPPPSRDVPVSSGDLSRNGYISNTSPSRKGATVPYPTGPNLTVPDLTGDNAPAPDPPGTPVHLQKHAPKRQPEQPLPGNYPLTDAMRTWAAQEVPELGEGLDRQHKLFCGHYHGKGNERRTDWRPVWESWMHRAVSQFPDRAASTALTTTGGSTHGRSTASEREAAKLRANLEYLAS